MSFDVDPDELDRAASRVREVSDPLASYSLDVGKMSSTEVGHVELAEWMGAVLDQCNKAGVALHDGADGLASDLAATATTYRNVDSCVATTFTGAVLQPGPVHPGVSP
jgi:hypothetical protein